MSNCRRNVKRSELKKILAEENDGLATALGGEVVHVAVDTALDAMQRAFNVGKAQGRSSCKHPFAK